MSCDWEGNRRSGVALAMRHRLEWFINLRAEGLSKRDEHPASTPHGVWYSLPFYHNMSGGQYTQSDSTGAAPAPVWCGCRLVCNYTQGHTGATWRIWLNLRRAAEMWPYVKLVRSLYYNCSKMAEVSRWVAIVSLWSYEVSRLHQSSLNSSSHRNVL